MWLKLFLIAILGRAGQGRTYFETPRFPISGIMSGNKMAGVPLGKSLGSGELDVEGICKESGVACQNCSHAISCIPLPMGWLKVPLQECKEGLTCNAHLGGCSSEAVPECEVATQKYQHTCEQVGIFPDAYDCRKFHLCSPPEGYPDGRPADHRAALCPKHYGYNPKTAQCSIKLVQGQCSQKPVPDCTKVSQSEALPTSTNHYYVCLMKHGQLYPQVFICPHGWNFLDGLCRPEPEIVNVTEKTDKDTSSEEVTTSTEKPTTSKIEGFFSTDKAVTYAADTFLADKIDLANYETTDDFQPYRDDFFNSFENEDTCWW